MDSVLSAPMVAAGWLAGMLLMVYLGRQGDALTKDPAKAMAGLDVGGGGAVLTVWFTDRLHVLRSRRRAQRPPGITRR